MPAIHGGLEEEEYEKFQEIIKSDPNFERESDAVRFSVLYTLKNKYGVEL